MLAIEAVSLTKTYRGGLLRRERLDALSGFSVAVDQGEIFSLLGPNGAGKTTFIKILLSLTHPTAGEARVLGETLPSVAVKKRVGYLPESHRYPGYLTGEQVLSFFGQLSGVRPDDLKARIVPLMDLVGMSQWRGMKVKKYSKGMMQRLGLAQALINDPDILFLDEPTDGVDPVGRKEIREILKDLKRKGKTIFLNSHLLSEVELISDRVAILNKGKLLTVGTVDELTAGGASYTIGIGSPLPDAVVQAAHAMVMSFSVTGDTLKTDCRTTGELNRMIDLLRTHGVEITSIVKQRNTLEDSFISLIKREVSS